MVFLVVVELVPFAARKPLLLPHRRVKFFQFLDQVIFFQLPDHTRLFYL